MKIDAKEFGLTDETATNIKLQFQPMLDKMVDLFVIPSTDIQHEKRNDIEENFNSFRKWAYGAIESL